MKAKKNLSKEEYNSVKTSFFNIYILFLNEENIDRHLVDCIMKWGLQLDLTEKELDTVIKKRDSYSFELPPKEEAIEQIYDLVYMIYLDNVVEDVELEVAMKFANKLGFEPHVVGDLLKAIVAAPADGIDHRQLRKEIKSLLLG
ncbi:MAG: hypothetical protein ACNS62_21055 [Candidatus Cyclobacteriaceae bacterium M3_2C_046]